MIVEATKDHKIHNELEKQYIKNHNGIIYCNHVLNKTDYENNNSYTRRFFRALHKFLPRISSFFLFNELAMSRSLGDMNLKKFTADDGTKGPLNSIPEIIKYDCPGANTIRMVLVTDGVTDKIPPTRMDLENIILDIITKTRILI